MLSNDDFIQRLQPHKPKQKDNHRKAVPCWSYIENELKKRDVTLQLLLRPAKAGEDIYLSFDARVQYIAHRELAKAVQKHEAAAAYLVAIDVKTGEILAMSSWPSYNPNDKASLNNKDAMRNRGAIDMFEPGSSSAMCLTARLPIWRWTKTRSSVFTQCRNSLQNT